MRTSHREKSSAAKWYVGCCLSAVGCLLSPALLAEGRADYLATTIETSWSFGEWDIGATEDVFIGDMFGALARYQVPFSVDIGVTKQYAPEPSDVPSAMGQDLRLRVYSINRYLYTLDIPGSTAAGSRSFVDSNPDTDISGTITNHFALAAFEPYTRTTWTVNSFTRGPWTEDQSLNLLTQFTMTGRFYAAVPEPSSLAMMIVMSLACGMFRRRAERGFEAGGVVARGERRVDVPLAAKRTVRIDTECLTD
jgi:hypothetical protein